MQCESKAHLETFAVLLKTLRFPAATAVSMDAYCSGRGRNLLDLRVKGGGVALQDQAYRFRADTLVCG